MSWYQNSSENGVVVVGGGMVTLVCSSMSVVVVVVVQSQCTNSGNSTLCAVSLKTYPIIALEVSRNSY
jgi:hypothetical protein